MGMFRWRKWVRLVIDGDRAEIDQNNGGTMPADLTHACNHSEVSQQRHTCLITRLLKVSFQQAAHETCVHLPKCMCTAAASQNLQLLFAEPQPVHARTWKSP